MTEKVILITGATSGIGQACAKHLAQKGHKVYGTGRNPQEQPAGYKLIAMDVNLDDSVKDALNQIIELEGHIDVVINNAGTSMMGSMEDTSIEQAKALFESNFFGLMRVCKGVLPQMREQNSGAIINISSIAGQVALPYRGLYSASKFAVEALTDAMRVEVGQFNINVSIIEPGAIKTNINDNRIVAESADANPAYQQKFNPLRDQINSGIEKGKDPMEVALTAELIINNSAPKARYPVASVMEKLSVTVKNHLPDSLLEWVLKVFYKL